MTNDQRLLDQGPRDRWKVDFHVHTCYSKDSLTPLEEVIGACQGRGIDKVAITDHNTIAGALALLEMAPDLVIVGEEIKTNVGEINARTIFPSDNRRTLDLARERGLLASAGSDAHIACEIGHAYVEMPAFNNKEEFLRGLAQGQIVGHLTSPLIHLVSTWAKLIKWLRG
jgi:predicted metal-dependent phosphoesterase TrpH